MNTSAACGRRTFVCRRVYTLSVLVLSLLAATLQTLALLYSFDSSVGYFRESPLTLCHRILGWVGVLLPILLTLLLALTRRTWVSEDSNAAPCRSLHRFWLFLSGGALAVVSVLFLLLWFGQIPTTLHTPFHLYLAVMGFALAVALGIAGIRCTRAVPPMVQLLPGLCGIAWMILAIGHTYFDNYTAMNSPLKLALQFGLIAAMPTVTATLRRCTERPSPRMEVCFLCLSLFFCLRGSLPILIATAAGVLHNVPHLLFAIMLFLFSLYAWDRLYHFFPAALQPIAPPPSADQASSEQPQPTRDAETANVATDDEPTPTHSERAC